MMNRKYSFSFSVITHTPVPSEQRGVALLTVLLLVVAITVLAGAMMAKQKIALRQYDLLQTQNQLNHDVQAGINFAVAMIQADAKINAFDGVSDAWAQPIDIPYGGENGVTPSQISMQIVDASGRFNLNNLYHDGAADEQAVDIFGMLLDQVGLEASLAYAVVDWQDPDSDTSPEGGAEADIYALQADSSTGNTTPAIRSQIGNQPFISVDELASVKGFDGEAVAKLKPYVTAVPYYLPINVNTASPELLNALSENGANFASFAEQMQTSPAQTLDDALAMSPWNGMESEQSNKLKPMLAVESGAFVTLIDISMPARNKDDNDRHRYVTAMISKIPANRVEQADTTASSNASMTNNEVGDDASQAVIEPFNIRQWTYRPTL